MTDSARQLDRLYQIIQIQSLITEAELNLDQFMQSTVDAVQQLCQAKGAVVELVDGDEMAYRCASGSIQQYAGLRLKRSGSLSGLCVSSREVLRCDDSETDERVDRAACRRVGVRSMVCTPLYRAGLTVGVLKVMAEEANWFDEEDVQTLRLMAAALGAALGNQLAFEEKNRVEAQLRSSEARVRAMLEHANDTVISMTEDGLVTEWNAAAERLFGWPAHEAIGRAVDDLIIPAALRAAHRQGLARFIATGHGAAINQRLELPALDRQGRSLVVEVSLSAMKVHEQWEFTAFMHDISERKRLETALSEMALRDGLTGLGNRRAFMDALDKVLGRARRHQHGFALLFMDMNGFKQINDQHGHQVGDEALREFAARLLKCVRHSDTVARLGGDEFTVLAEGITSEEQAEALALKIISALQHPIESSGVLLRSSFGITLYRGQADASQIMREADQAMYEAKRNGAANGVAMFEGQARP